MTMPDALFPNPSCHPARRRDVLGAGGLAALLAALGLPPPAQAQAAAALQLGAPQAFSFEALVARAQAIAVAPARAPAALPADVLERIDYDAHGRIRFRPELALFREGPGAFAATFFHLGNFFRTPVRMHVLQAAGGGRQEAREIVYRPDYFDMPAASPARALPEGAGFAGFRFQESRLGDQAKLPWQRNDWVAFLGASYFRAIGDAFQYGLSARGVAVNPAAPDGRAEEFPAFTAFWFEPPAPGGDTVVVYALLEGASLAGAYKFVMQRAAAVVMDVDCRLFLRRDVARLCLAPLTSMYWYSETTKREAIDWRPEVHDSDGLQLLTGAGEQIWRPLVNPPHTIASAFADRNPRGFGLMQRDRDFDHYQDGVMYQRRPGCWVEPQGDWGEGAVELIEIPTDDEIHDNVVAAWVPRAAAVAGSRYALRYRLTWAAEPPGAAGASTPARCVATRIGRGGQPGQPRPAGVRKFMVEFQGGALATLPAGVKPEAVLSAASGRFSYVFTEAVPDDRPGHWRAQFDYTPAGREAVDLRLFLRLDGRAISETWLYRLQQG